MLVPEFPKFDPIDIKHKDLVYAVCSGLEPYSDYNLLSLLSWNVDAANSISILNGNLVIKLRDYLGDSILHLFIGKKDIESSMRILLGKFGKLDAVPEPCLVASDQFVFTQDRSSFDYVYDLAALSSLQGSQYRILRKKISRFERSYIGASTRVSSVLDRNITEDVISLTEQWCHLNGFDDKKTSEDVEITQKFINYSKDFNCNVLGVYINGSMIAFTFNELLSDGWVMGHFGKALNSYEDSSIYTEHLTAKYLLTLGFKFLNHQQDTGLPGLRVYKESLRPSRYLRKYSVTLKV